MSYSDDNDKSDGCWIHFSDGHREYWDNARLENEISYRGLQLLKTQIKILTKKLYQYTPPVDGLYPTESGSKDRKENK